MNDEELKILKAACRSLRPLNDPYEWLSSAWAGFKSAPEGATGYRRARSKIVEDWRAFSHCRSQIKIFHDIEQECSNDEIGNIDNRDFLDWLLSPLNRKDRHVFTVTIGECKSQHEASRRLGMSQANIHIIVNRCLQHIRQRLRDHGIDRTISV